MAINTYDIIYSLQRFIGDRFGVQVDWVYDGYTYPKTKPFVTLEQLTDERIYRVKNREAVQVIEHIQVGYHARNIVEMTKDGERIADALTFNDVPLFLTAKSIDTPNGKFSVKVTSFVPMPSDDINRVSEHNRVYIDIEIEKIKRGC